MGVIGPFTRGVLSESLFVNSWLLSGGVGVPATCFGAGVNLTISTPFSAISLDHGGALVAFPTGLGFALLCALLSCT